jgi:hypothetical protein
MNENELKEWNGWKSKYHALGFFIWSILSKYKGFNDWESTLDNAERNLIKDEIISIIMKWEEDQIKL